LLLAQLKLELEQLTMRLEEADALIQQMAQESAVCRRLDAIPGIGPITATALIAAIGNGRSYSASANVGTAIYGSCSCKVPVLSCNLKRSNPPV
jgi:transposase